MFIFLIHVWCCSILKKVGRDKDEMKRSHQEKRKKKVDVGLMVTEKITLTLLILQFTPLDSSRKGKAVKWYSRVDERRTCVF